METKGMSEMSTHQYLKNLKNSLTCGILDKIVQQKVKKKESRE